MIECQSFLLASLQKKIDTYSRMFHKFKPYIIGMSGVVVFEFSYDF